MNRVPVLYDAKKSVGCETFIPTTVWYVTPFNDSTAYIGPPLLPFEVSAVNLITLAVVLVTEPVDNLSSWYVALFISIPYGF